MTFHVFLLKDKAQNLQETDSKIQLRHLAISPPCSLHYPFFSFPFPIIPRIPMLQSLSLCVPYPQALSSHCHFVNPSRFQTAVAFISVISLTYTHSLEVNKSNYSTTHFPFSLYTLQVEQICGEECFYVCFLYQNETVHKVFMVSCRMIANVQ